LEEEASYSRTTKGNANTNAGTDHGTDDTEANAVD
jgi:hypothetical protein